MGRKAPIRRVSDADISSLRDQLFESGSTFAPVKRSDIVGIDGLLDRLDSEIVLWLTRPDLFTRYGARLEPGVLFSGEPGTGKTMVARYLASCSNALFIAVRDFPVSLDMITAADIADLFTRARAFYAAKKRPVLIFWDEFEIHAKRRPDATTRDASVVSQIMSELDGVNGKCVGILFVGCTNFPDAVDSALKRHGRMGREIEFVAPDRDGKTALLRHYLGRHISTDELDLKSATYFLPGDATAATIEEACESVWRRALIDSTNRDQQPMVTQDLLNDVLLDELLGPPPPFMNTDAPTLRNVARHELGHALVARQLGVLQVMTVRPGRSTFGRVLTVSEEEPGFFSADQHRNQIAIGLGALAMENLLELVTSGGIEGDLKQATRLAVVLIERLAQHPWLESGWIGPVHVQALEGRASYSDVPILSPRLLDYFDREVSRVLREGYQQAYRILLSVSEEVIERLADRFVEEKTWTGRQFEEVYAGVVEEVGRPVLQSVLA